LFDFQVRDQSEDSRSSILRLGERRFRTPYYCLIHTDMKRLIHGSNLIHQQIPRINLHEIVKDFSDQEKLDRLLSNIQLRDHLKRIIIKDTKSRTQNIFQLRFPNNIRLSGHQLKALVEIQAETEKLSVITLPDPVIRDASQLWENAMETGLREANKICETGLSYVVMPIVSLDQPITYVESKINWLINQDVQAIGLRATGQFSPRFRKATEILANSEQDIWTHLFDLKKTYLDVSQVHLVPLIGIDTISTKKIYSASMYHILRGSTSSIDNGDFATPVGIPLPEAQQQIRLRPRRPPRDLFEGRALGFLSEQERLETFGHELNCPCGICRRARSMTSLVEMLSQMQRKSLLQIHETVSFSMELNQIQTAIHNNDLSDYYISKTLINEKIDQLSNKYHFLRNLQE